jgi:hypothetical protein
MDKEIINELTGYFDERYVRQKDCSERHEQTNEKINDMAINQATQGADISAIKKFQWLIESTIVTGFLGAVVTFFIITK